MYGLIGRITAVAGQREALANILLEGAKSDCVFCDIMAVTRGAPHRTLSRRAEVTMSRVSRVCLVAIATCIASYPVPAQQSGTDVSVTAPLDSQYAGDLTVLHDKVLALANAIPADRYSWRPSDQVRTVSQVLMHIAGEWYYICPISVAGKPPSDFGPPGEAMRKLEEITAKAEVLAQLDSAWAHCRSVLDSVDPARLVPDSLPAGMGFPRVVLLVSGDQHEHLGQLIAYARSIGVTPPWSR